MHNIHDRVSPDPVNEAFWTRALHLREAALFYSQSSFNKFQPQVQPLKLKVHFHINDAFHALKAPARPKWARGVLCLFQVH